jgi:hypothetical protein
MIGDGQMDDEVRKDAGADVYGKDAVLSLITARGGSAKKTILAPRFRPFRKI